MSKTAILFVPGAWHTAEAFKTVARLLEAEGLHYKGLHMPSATKDGPYVQGIEEDISLIQRHLDDLSEAGYDVVVVMHSYGGVPGTSACKNFSKEERAAQGKKGGVKALIFISAFAFEEGVSQADVLGEQLLPWIKIHGPSTYAIAENSRELFYNDITDEEAAKWESKLQRQATKAFWGKVSYAAWKYIPSTYVVCTLDKAIPAENQEGMAKQNGKFVGIERLETGHSPFLSQPENTASCILKVASQS